MKLWKADVTSEKLKMAGESDLGNKELYKSPKQEKKCVIKSVLP